MGVVPPDDDSQERRRGGCHQDLRASVSGVFDSRAHSCAESPRQSASEWVLERYWISGVPQAEADRQPPSGGRIGTDFSGSRSCLKTKIEVLRFQNWDLRRRTWARMGRSSQAPDQWLRLTASASVAPGIDAVCSVSAMPSWTSNTHKKLSRHTRFQRLRAVVHLVDDGGGGQVVVMTSIPAPAPLDHPVPSK